MDDKPSKLWDLALVFTLLLLAGVLYYRFAPVREMVDAKCPWIKEQLAQQGIQFQGAAETAPAPVSDSIADRSRTSVAGADRAQQRPAAGGAQRRTNPAAQPVEAAAAQPVEAAAAQPVEATAAQPVEAAAAAQAMSMAQIAANRLLWPKTVSIKKEIEFPAVCNGKAVGKLNVPAGTEVKVISVTADKVGVVFSPDGTMANAGGAWLSAADTDILARVRKTP